MNNIVELNQQEVAAISGGGVTDYVADAYNSVANYVADAYNSVANFVEEHPYISAGVASVVVIGGGVGVAYGCGCFASALEVTSLSTIERLAKAGIAKKVM